LVEFENKFMILNLISCRFTLHQIKEKTISVYVSARPTTVLASG